MTAIAVGRLAPGRQWDQNLVDELLANRLYPTSLEFARHNGYPTGHEGCVLIVPGRYWAGHEEEIADALAHQPWVLGIRCGDEEDLFDVAKVTHPNARWWVQTPHPNRDYGPSASRYFGVGFPPHFNDLGDENLTKDLDVFLSGQNTHDRRQRTFSALAADPGDTESRRFIHPTDGFTHGLPADEYVATMLRAKVAPAPAGPVTADTFRVWEALEAHTVPLVDTLSPAHNVNGYWDRVLPGAPITLYSRPPRLPAVIEGAVGDWPECANRTTAWWMRYKRQMAGWLVDDLKALGAL